MIHWIKKHWEVLSYLIFGVLTTLLNIVLYALFNKLFGYTAANSWGNVLDNIICILFAYCTNRAFVFRSKTQGKAMAREFGAFVTCRLGTMLLDTAIMLVLGNLLAAQGAALMARPLRPAYHFCAQDWMDGYRNAVPSPAGILNARKKLPALPPGRMAAAKNPPHSSAVPHRAAHRGPRLSCRKPPRTHPTPNAAMRMPKA